MQEGVRIVLGGCTGFSTASVVHGVIHNTLAIFGSGLPGDDVLPSPRSTA